MDAVSDIESKKSSEDHHFPTHVSESDLQINDNEITREDFLKSNSLPLFIFLITLYS